MPRPTLIREAVQNARDNFVGWLRWHWYEHRADIRSQADLARAIGITPATLSYLFGDPSRYPSFETLIAAQQALGVPMDFLIGRPAPAVPERW